MTTALNLIETAAVKLGAIATGEALTADEASDSLEVLNSMLELWATDHFYVYQIVQNNYSWASGNASRTIGSGGNFNATRPVKILDGTFFRTNNQDYPVRILGDRREYDAIFDKTVQGPYPEFLYYNPAYPLGVIYVYPVPSQTLTLYLNSWNIIQNFSALTTDTSLPPGYKYLIEYNLAIELGPVFSLEPSPMVVSKAAIAKRQISRLNHVPVQSVLEVPGVLGQGRRSDIVADR